MFSREGEAVELRFGGLLVLDYMMYDIFDFGVWVFFGSRLTYVIFFSSLCDLCQSGRLPFSTVFVEGT